MRGREYWTAVGRRSVPGLEGTVCRAALSTTASSASSRRACAPRGCRARSCWRPSASRCWRSWWSGCGARSASTAIVIATTEDPSCDPIEALAARARRRGLPRQRGRRAGARARRGAGVGRRRHRRDDRRLPADRPARGSTSWSTPTCGDGGCDFCSNTLTETFPRGTDVRVFSTAALAEVAATTNDPADREHVSLYFWTHPERYHLREVRSPDPSLGDLRLTVDTPEDLALVRAVFERLYPQAPASASTRSPRCCASTPRSGPSTRTSSRRPSAVDAGGGHRLRAHRLGAGRDRPRARRAEPRRRLRRLAAHRAGGRLRRRPRPGHARRRAVGRAGLRRRRRPAAQRPPGARRGRHARRDARRGRRARCWRRPACAARWSRSRSRSTRGRRRRSWRWRSASGRRARRPLPAPHGAAVPRAGPAHRRRARSGSCSTCTASTPPASRTTARTGSTSCACWRARSRGSRRPTGWGRAATTRPSTSRSASPTARAARLAGLPRTAHATFELDLVGTAGRARLHGDRLAPRAGGGRAEPALPGLPRAGAGLGGGGRAARRGAARRRGPRVPRSRRAASRAPTGPDAVAALAVADAARRERCAGRRARGGRARVIRVLACAGDAGGAEAVAPVVARLWATPDVVVGGVGVRPGGRASSRGTAWPRRSRATPRAAVATAGRRAARHERRRPGAREGAGAPRRATPACRRWRCSTTGRRTSAASARCAPDVVARRRRADGRRARGERLPPRARRRHRRAAARAPAAAGAARRRAGGAELRARAGAGPDDRLVLFASQPVREVYGDGLGYDEQTRARGARHRARARARARPAWWCGRIPARPTRAAAARRRDRARRRRPRLGARRRPGLRHDHARCCWRRPCSAA